MKRINITQHDVFISWTGKDRALKNIIVEYLESNGITCLESDHDCSGDFRQWSHEAVNACNVFLLICSENIFDSEYVPVEIEEFLKWEDYYNRMVPVFKDTSLYRNEPWGISEYASAVFLDGENTIEKKLEDILRKVQLCNINLLDKVYRNGMKTKQIRVNPLYKTRKIRDREFVFLNLYVERVVSKREEVYDASVFCGKHDEIFFISGPAGIGKTCYINQIREVVDKETVTIVLSCYKYADSADDVFEAMYKEFCNGCGNKYYYSQENFKSLLNNRHLLLVFDALDEIPTVEGTRKLIRRIEKYYRVNKENTTLIFTGRNEDDAELVSMAGDKVNNYVLEKLSEEDIRTLSCKLLSLLGIEEKKEEFLESINNLDDQIKTNPLLVSQLAIIYDEKQMIPQTIVGIYDAISEIMLAFDKYVEMDVPENYKDMVTKKLPDILKEFSAERYILQSSGKATEISRIFSSVLKSRYREERKERAEFLVEYLQNRAIIIDGEFYHKMLLEYYTAVYYFENIFNDYDEIENDNIIEELFSHYKNPYWSTVLKMFLMKADEAIDEHMTRQLYFKLMTMDIREYTLLFDTCRELVENKETVQKVLVRDILLKSVEGTYPPYGPLFWYIPEYNLYDILILVLDSLKKEKNFAKMTALVRDVCFIMGRKYVANKITDRIDVSDIYEVAKGELHGVRKALCELFYLGETDYKDGDYIYPRCFNIKESQSFMENDCGVLDIMDIPFRDELELYKETAYNKLEDEYIGFVSCPYNIVEIEYILNKMSCRKLRGMILTPSENRKMSYISFNRIHLEVIYIPENIKKYDRLWDEELKLLVSIGKYKHIKIYVGENIKIPKNMSIIPKRIFRKCLSMKRCIIPEGVIRIEKEAFRECSNLNTISIPEGVTKIEFGAFRACSNLFSVELPKGIIEVAGTVFDECSRLETVNIPNGVTKIGNFAFSGCSCLEIINLPESVQKLGPYAFSYCKSLKKINIPNTVECIDFYSFMGCSSLETIDLPDSVMYIFDEAFKSCSNLKKIRISQRLCYISEEAFADCGNLQIFEIPKSVFRIRENAFKGCKKISRIKVSSDVEIAWNAFEENVVIVRENDEETIQEYIDICIEYGEIRIKEKEFAGRRDVRTIVIPDTVKEIGEEAFRSCSSLISVEMPNTIKKISYDMFRDCSSLVSIYIPESVTEIEEDAFRGCRSLRSIHIPNSVKEIGVKTFFECVNLEIVDIPCGITEISGEIFYNCRNLKTIRIPESVTEIGGSAFEGCIGLEEVYLPNSVKKIEESAFKNCVSLRSVNIPKEITEISVSMFSGCKSLGTISIPEIVTTIDAWAFEGCETLTKINIPSQITRLPQGVFSKCFRLTSIEIPENVTMIEERLFEECKALSLVNMPKEIFKIEEFAFYNCLNLTSIEIPPKVIEIQKSAFEKCVKLQSVNVPSSVRIIGDNAFLGCSSLNSITISRRYEDDIQRIFGDIDRNIITFI